MGHGYYPDFETLEAMQEEQARVDKVESERLADEFVVAAALGHDAAFDDTTVSMAVYEATCQNPALVDDILYYAARQTGCDELTALVRRIGTAYADIKIAQANR